MQRLLTVQQVAHQLQLPAPRVYELVRTGSLPCVKIGRQVRFDPEQLAQWIANGGRPLEGGWRRTPEAEDPTRGTRSV